MDNLNNGFYKPLNVRKPRFHSLGIHANKVLIVTLLAVLEEIVIQLPKLFRNYFTLYKVMVEQRANAGVFR